MAIERERGISVSSAVMSFEHKGLAFNLLDTPGHQDFSEDTYRTLTAVDSAAMVLEVIERDQGENLPQLGLLYFQRFREGSSVTAGIDTVIEVQIPVADGVADQDVACYDGSGCAYVRSIDRVSLRRGEPN
jgi:hypothetical protein